MEIIEKKLNLHYLQKNRKNILGWILDTKNKKANSTWCSQAVTHPSTNQAQCCLTSVIGRELVLSTWYGRWQCMFGIEATWKKNKKERWLETSIYSFEGEITSKKIRIYSIISQWYVGPSWLVRRNFKNLFFSWFLYFGSRYGKSILL